MEAGPPRSLTTLCLDLGLPASRTVRNSFLLFVNYPGSILCYSSRNGLRHWGQTHQDLLPTPRCPMQAVTTQSIDTQGWPWWGGRWSQIKKGRVCPKGASGLSPESLARPG